MLSLSGREREPTPCKRARMSEQTGGRACIYSTSSTGVSTENHFTFAPDSCPRLTPRKPLSLHNQTFHSPSPLIASKLDND